MNIIAEIQSVENKDYFVYNGVNTPKNYEARKVGENELEIISANRDKVSLLNIADYRKVKVNGVVLNSVSETVSKINEIVFKKGGGSGMGGQLDLGNLTNTQMRMIKNASEKINKGGFNIGNIPDSYDNETFTFIVKSSTASDEEFILRKGASGGYNRYSLGEPVYSIYTKEEAVGNGLQTGEYYYIPAFPSGQILFGRNLGNIPANTFLGEIPFNNSNLQSLYIGKSNFGGDLIKYSANILVTNNSTQNLYFDVKQESQYFGRTILPVGVSTSKEFYNQWNYFYLYFTPKQNLTLIGGLKIETFVNGVSRGYNQWGAGTQFWQDGDNWIPQPYGLQNGDNVEIIISDF